MTTTDPTVTVEGHPALDADSFDPFDQVRAIKSAQHLQAASGEIAVIHAENMARNINHMAAQIHVALDCLENLTMDDFEHGGDRPARVALVSALMRCGGADAELRHEYPEAAL